MPATLLVVAAGIELLGLGSSSVEAWRDDLLSRAADGIERDLARQVRRLSAALREAPAGLDVPRGRMAALEAVRERTHVDGLDWAGPDGRHAWAGRPVDGPDDPPPLPWRDSFRHGGLLYHRGPYLAALTAGPVPAAGGALEATVVLEATGPSERQRPYEERWLAPYGLERVEVLPPDRPLAAEEGTLDFLVRGPPDPKAGPGGEGEPALRVRLVAPGDAAILDRIDEARRGWTGLAWLLLSTALGVLATGLLLRYVRAGAGRRLVLAVLVLVLRGLLVPIDLPGRWPALAAAFDPSDFGIPGALGWLASPADLALSGAALLAAFALAAAALVHVRPPRRPALRASFAIGGPLLCGGLTALHLDLVRVVVVQSQAPFFETTSFLPSLPSALLLLGLVAWTATAWVIAATTLWLATLALPRLAHPLRILLPALLAVGVAFLLADGPLPAWAPCLLPLSTLFARLRPGDEAVTTVPSASLLVGVLATFLLFPLLWSEVCARRVFTLATTLDDLLRKEASLRGATLYELESARGDATLKNVLRAARDGPTPEALGLYLWRRSFLAEPGEHGVVSVLYPDGRLLDDFSLTPLPRGRVPLPAPPAEGAGDVQVVTARGDGNDLRAVVGRALVRDEDGTPLGVVVLTVPEPIDLAFLGPEVLGGATGDAPTQAGVRAFDLAFAMLVDGRVVRASDPTVAQRADTFGPPLLREVGPARSTLTWQNGDEEGHAVWSPERGAVVAVRRDAPSPADTVLALARLVTLGVGAACLVALVTLLLGAPSWRPRLQHRLLLSYFGISFLPILLLGLATAREVRLRHNAYLSQRLETDVRRARTDLEAMGTQVFDQASEANLVRWANQRRHDLLLYRDGEVLATSRSGLVEAEVLPSRLPPDAWRATVRERREIVRREAVFAGHPVWFGYAPVLDDRGRVLATVGVPLLYDKDLVAEELAVTGNVLVAAYLFALVLVLVSGLWTARRLTRPIRLLAAGTRRVTAGELDVVLRPEGRDELGDLVAAFNAMTRALREATDRAIRAERESAWRRMARQVAHEIKNPLTPIRLMIQQMKAEADRDPARAPEAIRRTAPVVLRQIEALGRIAGDFAQYARLPRRDISDVDVGALVDDVVLLHAGSAAEGVEVAGDRPDELPAVRWDAEELRRVLVNLVGNAVQAIRGSGHVVVRARPRSLRGRDGVTVEVTDDGVGIPPENLERIFEPDFSTRTAGTGLGLAMVRRTVDDMGGTVEVESEPGRGSTFRLWWPLRGASA